MNTRTDIGQFRFLFPEFSTQNKVMSLNKMFLHLRKVCFKPFSLNYIIDRTPSVNSQNGMFYSFFFIYQF